MAANDSTPNKEYRIPLIQAGFMIGAAVAVDVTQGALAVFAGGAILIPYVGIGVVFLLVGLSSLLSVAVGTWFFLWFQTSDVPILGAASDAARGIKGVKYLVARVGLAGVTAIGEVLPVTSFLPIWTIGISTSLIVVWLEDREKNAEDKKERARQARRYRSAKNRAERLITGARVTTPANDTEEPALAA